VKPVWLALLLLTLWAGAAQAHTRSYSYSLWELDNEPWLLTVRINQYDLTRLQLHPAYSDDYQARVRQLVRERLVLTADGQACDLQLREVHLNTDGWVRVSGQPSCPQQDRLMIRSQLLLDAVSAHMHFVTVRDGQGGVAEKVLTETDNHWAFAGAEALPQAPQSLGSYWWLGIEHILSGWDHLAFVFGLLLLAGSLTQLAWLVTGFTLAHSITLALAALGQVQPVSSAVEALIGLSILLVALENTWERSGKPLLLPALACVILLALAGLGAPGLPALALLGVAVFVAAYFRLLTISAHAVRWRLLIVFAFGLFHGFGFAGILAEMALPEERLLTALFGFNLGVECGQLVVVVVLWPLLRGLSRRLPVEQLGTTAIAGLGTFWFITRALA